MMSQPNQIERNAAERTGPVMSNAERKPLSLAAARLRKHADYQRVYRQGRKQFSQQMAYFFALRPAAQDSAQPITGAVAGPYPGPYPGPRIGLTVGKVLGKAVDRNRIKRRMREAVRHNLAILTTPVDVVLHPRRSVKEVEFAALQREVARIFTQIQRATTQPAAEAAVGKNPEAPKDSSRAETAL
jgi:ribonuclease P protein component